MKESSGVRSLPRSMVLLLAVVTLAGGVASGCGGGDDEATSTAPPATAVTETGDGQVATGAQLFSSNCESCHGTDGAGGHVGPDLQKSSVAENLEAVETQVRNGGGGMPPFADVLSDEEIDTVAQYVVEQIAPKG